MKKVVIMLLAIMMSFGITVTAFASSSLSEGELIHFVPTEIAVWNGKVLVDGYFINLNEDCAVMDFKDVSLELYYEGRCIIDADFKDPSRNFIVEPLSAYSYSFEFIDDVGLNEGLYACDDATYCMLSCRFSTVRR